MRDKDATLYEHLEELRRRILTSLGFFLLFVILSLPFVPAVVERMRQDLFSGYFFVVISPLEAVTVELEVSALIGLFISLPVIAYEVWAYVSPALRGEERRTIFRLLIPSVFMFLAGASFAYFLVLPVALHFLLESAKNMAVPMLSLGESFGFVVFTVAVFGMAFELPLILYALAKIGLVDHRLLSSKRRYVIVFLFVVAAAVTPDPSPVTQILVAVPMVLLYEASILLVRYARR